MNFFARALQRTTGTAVRVRTRVRNNVVAWPQVGHYFGLIQKAPRKLPPILINTMPKSGSIYLTRTIATSLGIEYSLRSVVDGLFPTYSMIPEVLDHFRRGDVVRQEHLDASPLNLATCARYIDRIVLHVRDPRQATLSWTHHFNRLLSLHLHSTAGAVHRPPEQYCRWAFRKQLDWHIDHHLVSLVAWLRQWKAAEENPPIKILRTQYEELINNERALFNRILEFYGVCADGIDMRPPKKTTKSHYRVGRADEWRDVFTAEQKTRSHDIIGRDILQHFGWTTD
jgi:Sulfotransferase domain